MKEKLRCFSQRMVDMSMKEAKIMKMGDYEKLYEALGSGSRGRRIAQSVEYC